MYKSQWFQSGARTSQPLTLSTKSIASLRRNPQYEAAMEFVNIERYGIKRCDVLGPYSGIHNKKT